MEVKSLNNIDTTQVLTSDDDLSFIYEKISRSKRIVFLTGAGISCSAGIPDFRSSDGLYNMTDGLSTNIKGRDLFDISLFQSPETIRCFSIFMSNLYSSSLDANPTKTHLFIHDQIKRNKVLRCYTQNVDGLESRLGLNTKFDNDDGTRKTTTLQKWKSMDAVQLHGDLNELSCTTCGKITGWTEEYQKLLSKGELPECLMCIDTIIKRAERGKRMTGSVGLLRPNIVLYGENHPFSDIITTGLNSDLKQRPDLLIVMGTSLKVHGVKQIVNSMSKIIHHRGGKVILINKDIITGWNGKIDYQVQSDCDSFVENFKDFECQQSKMLQTPPSTPRKSRIRDILNTPSPAKKRTFSIYKDAQGYPSPEESPKKSPRAVRSLNFGFDSNEKYIRRSPRLHKIKTLLNDDIQTRGHPLSKILN